MTHYRLSITREQEVIAAKTHLQLLNITLQRLGGCAKPAVEYEWLATKAWNEFGPELSAAGVKEDQVRSKGWKVDGFGKSKSEDGDKGAFNQPESWGLKT